MFPTELFTTQLRFTLLLLTGVVSRVTVFAAQAALLTKPDLVLDLLAFGRSGGAGIDRVFGADLRKIWRPMAENFFSSPSWAGPRSCKGSGA